MWLESGDLAPDGPSIEQFDNSINIAQNPQEQDLQTVPRFTAELNLYNVCGAYQCHDEIVSSWENTVKSTHLGCKYPIHLHAHTSKASFNFLISIACL